MTREEIKARYTMREVAERYGLHPNRRGFCHCPFHSGDRTASLKIYDRDFNCFGCGANGDVFSFVERMEQVDFQEAFRILGGTYGKPTYASRLAIYHSQKRREMEQKRKARELARRKENYILIEIYRNGIRRAKPLSEAWCDCYNELQKQLYTHAELHGLEARW